MNLFGGNKIRKLEYLLGEAKAFGCEYAITYGATPVSYTHLDVYKRQVHGHDLPAV